MKSKFLKRTEAIERQAYWRGLTSQAQLAALIARGAGGCKQAQRLKKQLDKA